ncbi:hypothetical protein SMACR_00333 [Sordaria macrospora]|nr:hypothetical protein SMACR_00333 [Sordaria macrospora]KAH7627722.1 hypothetical protein B0T09DRAFT_189802 [Sordaria sp. MPI-SDFR-AT-0083]WPJ59077.1 hypothetical protein SMAC4_00333 [Sordaria macrospora]
MAIAAMASTTIASPDIKSLVRPVLSALPGASASTEPATTVLPLLSPILRQRVQLLSGASSDPWIRLLTYDTSKVSKLTEIAQSGSLDPHPVSGEVEMDWDYDVHIKYRRLDQETLQTLVALGEFDLFIRLVYCVNDKDGGGDGWRVGEIGVASDPSPLQSFGGYSTLDEAEKAFKAQQTSVPETKPAAQVSIQAEPVEEDDDDDYWGRYDATPSQTPGQGRSPAPPSLGAGLNTQNPNPFERSASAEDAYFAQYESVQPAMDPHDPDEEALQGGPIDGGAPLNGLLRRSPSPKQQIYEPPVTNCALAPPPLGLSGDGNGNYVPSRSPSDESGSGSSGRRLSQADEERTESLAHPRPASSASSNGSRMVAKLEETAEAQDRVEFGIKQHVSRSIRSLFQLSRGAGISREEFDRMVRNELDVLAMVENDV